jgi:hypothetical protein
VSVVEDGRMDGYYEVGEKYRNKRNYVPPRPLKRNYVPPRPLRPPSSPYEEGEKYRNKRNYVRPRPLIRATWSGKTSP